MEEIGVLEVGKDIGGTQVIVGENFGIRRRGFGELYGVEQVRGCRKCGGVRERCLEHNGHKIMGSDGSRCVNG